MPSFSDWLFGSPDKLEKVPTGTKQQLGLHNDVISNAKELSQGGYQNAQNYYDSLFQPGNQAYENFSAPYMNQFQEQILPQIAERFAGAGALSSSGFGQALGGAGAGLQAKLAELFASLQSQAAEHNTNQYNQLSEQGLNYQPFAYNKKQGSGGALMPILTGLATAAGGPLAGMAAGGISSLFKNGGGGFGGSPLTSGGQLPGIY